MVGFRYGQEPEPLKILEENGGNENSGENFKEIEENKKVLSKIKK